MYIYILYSYHMDLIKYEVNFMNKEIFETTDKALLSLIREAKESNNKTVFTYLFDARESLLSAYLVAPEISFT